MAGDISAYRECLFHGLLKRKGQEPGNGVSGLPLLVQDLFK